MIARLVCWWFGCRPAEHAYPHGGDCFPCERCGADDTSYADQVGDTRHARAMAWLRWWLWWRWLRWLPARCPACGERFKCRGDCDGIPF